MASLHMHRTSLVFTFVAKHKVWFGVTFSECRHLWVVWSCAPGEASIPLPLTAWRSRERAEAVLDSYLEAGGAGLYTFVREVRASRRSSDQVEAPEFTAGERRDLATIMSKA